MSEDVKASDEAQADPTPAGETAQSEGAGHATATIEYHFNREDVAQLQADDSTAGKAIGKMLSLMFLYTAIMMGIVGYITYRSLF